MNADMKRKLQAFADHCHKHGLRVTPQRVAIYKELVASDKHPSATDVYKQIRRDFPHISLATVNSTLITLSEIGLARVVESSGDPKRFDPDTELHHHFRCVKCNQIVDFHDETYDNIIVPAEIARKFIVLGKKVYLEGLCDKCRIKYKANS